MQAACTLQPRAPGHALRSPAPPRRQPRNWGRRPPPARAVAKPEAPQASRPVAADLPAADLPTDASRRRDRSLLPPFFTRATQLEEFVPGQLHALCQPFALPGADIRLRCVVARLPAIGGLLLVSPVAPTPECLDLLAGLARGGQVEHIVLPSASPEHW